jgi:hypothetical protein
MTERSLVGRAASTKSAGVYTPVTLELFRQQIQP